MITVFTTTTCAYCQMLKKYLTMKGYEYNVVNLEDDPERRQELLEKTGSMTVPITQVDDEFVIGWNPSLLNKALGVA